MGRTVVSKKDIAAWAQQARETALRAAAEGSLASVTAPKPAAEEADEYRDRLIKYIPADVVAIYLTLTGLVKLLPSKAPVQAVGWGLFTLILLISVPWQRKIVKITKWKQVLIGSVAFVIWAISLGDPFASAWQSWYYPAYGTMAVALYTFLIPLFEA